VGHAGAFQLWGIGGPVYPGRFPAELAERQLCDLVQIYSWPGGTAIRLYQNL
jgi:hypothetical protein